MIESSRLNYKIAEKISQIEVAVDKTWPQIEHISLMTGLGGVPILYAQLDKLENSEKRREKIYNVIEKIFDRLEKEKFIVTYSSGIIGVAFMLNLLQKEGVLDNDVDEHLSFFDELIIDKALVKFTNFEHIDFLHGRLGAANYYLERIWQKGSLTEKEQELFHAIADVVNDQVDKSKSVRDLDEFDDLTHRTNCGLAHGHTSVLLIFSKYLQHFPTDAKVRNALRNSIECLLMFESDHAYTKALFPGIAVNKKTAYYEIPLGWCYGDQTIAYGLYRASKVLKSVALAEKAQQIATRTLKRDTFDKALSNASDAAFCHGASSLAYLNKIFHSLYQQDSFDHLYQKFANVVLEKGNFEDGIAGYKRYLGNGEFENAIGLLDGIIGIGLFLSDWNSDGRMQIDWPSCFLLSEVDGRVT